MRRRHAACEYRPWALLDVCVCVSVLCVVLQTVKVCMSFCSSLGEPPRLILPGIIVNLAATTPLTIGVHTAVSPRDESTKAG